jgi:hypothetical protein
MVHFLIKKVMWQVYNLYSNVYRFSFFSDDVFHVKFDTCINGVVTVADCRQELKDRINQVKSGRLGTFHLVPPSYPGESIPKDVFPLQPVKIWESDYCDISQMPLL